METPTFETECQSLKQKIRSAIDLKLAESDCLDILKNAVRTHCALSGSAISSIYHNVKPNDFDFYFHHKSTLENFSDLIRSYDGFMNAVADWNAYENDNDIPIVPNKAVTQRAITFKNDIQMITMATLSECRVTFDFLHCMPYYDYYTDTLYISQRQWWNIHSKTLEVNLKRTTPVSQDRLNKFFSRGWTLKLERSTDLTKTVELV